MESLQKNKQKIIIFLAGFLFGFLFGQYVESLSFEQEMATKIFNHVKENKHLKSNH